MDVCGAGILLAPHTSIFFRFFALDKAQEGLVYLPTVGSAIDAHLPSISIALVKNTLGKE
ncbi:hypothetical protein KSB_06050 [Ktedonobacter robiniae]|uniref:Uncharacterized protein n=1 Tax=Ktedonobacter robiniae TaxID=2778365 RepID=A0ABQ3UHR7_9CHLR|nr:hypothetical protein KSB_06050 [Ktedonobacter robiniae]